MRAWAVAAFVMLVLLAVAIAVLGSSRRDAADSPAGGASEQALARVALLGSSETPAPQSSPVPEATRGPDEAPLPLYDDPAIQARWTSEGVTEYTKQEVRMLPILDYAKHATDRVAITVDDCFQFDNVREILDLADEYGAKLTFFPIGYQIAKQPEIWKEILDRGHELENHSYHHLNTNGLSDQELFQTIAMQERAMSKALGVNYKMKYFRPRGGYSKEELRLSKVLRDLGYQAIASWGLSGSQDVSSLLKKCSGGHVILFHTTDKDLKKLRKVIPALKKKGLKMVTLNELYDKPRNVITPLTTPPPVSS